MRFLRWVFLIDSFYHSTFFLSILANSMQFGKVRLF